MASETTYTDKRSDSFSVGLNQFFDVVAKNSKVFIGLLVVLVVIGAVGALMMSKREARAENARTALFGAVRTLDTEMKKVAEQYAPPASKTEAKDEEKAEGKDKDAKETAKEKAKAKEAESLDAMLFKKLDVDAKFPEGVKALNSVAQEYSGTRAGYEARVILANLYLEHGDAAKAAPQYQKAVDSAPANFERAISLQSLGYAYENSGKAQDAIQTYERALNVGEVSIRGDVLLALGRSYEAVNDPNKARSIYDQITSQLPNTDYAKTAELYKSRLGQ